MKKKSIVAVFGSAFNPPHRGHEDVIQQALGQASSVVVVPSFRHAFGKKMMDFELRLRMVKVMIADMKAEALVGVSNIEQKLAEKRRDDQPIYTYDVMEALEEHYQTDQLVFVIGPDNAKPEIWRAFYKSEEIEQRWNLWVAQERVNIRSTGIREKLAQGIYPSLRDCSPGVIQLLKESGACLH